MVTVNKLQAFNDFAYHASARPSWDSCSRVDVRPACSAEEFAHLYPGVSSRRGARSVVHFKSGGGAPRVAAIRCAHIRSSMAPSGLVRAAQKAPGTSVIGVPSCAWGLFISAIGNPPRRITRRPLSLCGSSDPANIGGSGDVPART